MNGYLKRSGLLAAALLVCLGLTPAAQGASFDCGKAGTKVEHIICDNPEISKLDDELSVAYKVALRDEKQAGAIKQAQKQWMKERNDCSEAACVQSAYQKRIEQLHSTQSATAQAQAATASPQVVKPGGASSVSAASANIYPPYPDVWDWVLPDREKIASMGVRLVGMDTGDVLIGYGIYDKGGKYVDIQPFTLFGHLTVTDEFASQRVASSQLPVVHLSNGTSAHLESADEAFKSILQGIPLTSGRNLHQGGFEVVGAATEACYHGIARGIYSITDSNRKLLKSVAIFKLLDTPILIDRTQSCVSDTEFSFSAPISTHVWGGVQVWSARSLADGGFVMLVDKGVLIRFDKDFNSRSHLINNKYFVLDNMGSDTGDVEDWLYINRITGKNYKNRSGYYDHQAIVDDLYNYLIALKAKKGAAK